MWSGAAEMDPFQTQIMRYKAARQAVLSGLALSSNFATGGCQWPNGCARMGP